MPLNSRELLYYNSIINIIVSCSQNQLFESSVSLFTRHSQIFFLNFSKLVGRWKNYAYKLFASTSDINLKAFPLLQTRTGQKMKVSSTCRVKESDCKLVTQEFYTLRKVVRNKGSKGFLPRPRWFNWSTGIMHIIKSNILRDLFVIFFNFWRQAGSVIFPHQLDVKSFWWR